MAKKFNIHEWQAKQRLAEQDDFTPDLEDDELKRGAIRQMMDKEKSKTPQEAPIGTLRKTIEDLAEIYSYGEILDSLKVFYTDNDEKEFAEMAKKPAKEFRDFLGPDVDSPSEEYSKIEKAWDNLDRSEQKSIIDDVLSGEARPDEYEKSFDQLSDENEEFESAITNYLGLDEQNVTGTGASFNAGDGAGYATPNAFAKKSNWRRKNEKYEE